MNGDIKIMIKDGYLLSEVIKKYNRVISKRFVVLCTYIRIEYVHVKNNFVEASKNLARQRSENNFVEPSK